MVCFAKMKLWCSLKQSFTELKNLEGDSINRQSTAFNWTNLICWRERPLASPLFIYPHYRQSKVKRRHVPHCCFLNIN